MCIHTIHNVRDDMLLRMMCVWLKKEKNDRSLLIIVIIINDHYMHFLILCWKGKKRKQRE